jgi:predicted metal-dependent hydrolase
MEKEIKHGDKSIKYDLKVSKRSKRLRLAVYCDGRCVVTAPRFMPGFLINKFVVGKYNWIMEKIDFLKKFNYKYKAGGNRAEYLEHKETARQIAKERIGYFNQFYNFRVNKINIKNQKSRWGSCSKKGNLNFNYKITVLPDELRDYVVVHELCHLQEFNHSQNFWSLVGQTIPDYREIKKEFRKTI